MSINPKEGAPKEAKPPKKGAIALKTPKGTRDWIGADINLRDDIFANISRVFKAHGGTPLDTPVFELSEILTNKYGEDSRLIYELQDQGGELCSLRYDLTVPLARYLAQSSTLNMKRYQIAKVYRRDNPSIARGRLREFFQCDFDTVGEYDTMIPDSEILCIAVEVFESLGMADDITIKLNHRKILDGLFRVAGVPEDKIRPISSAVDKLDKAPWAEVKKEMVEEKGLDEAVADKIGEYVKHSGGPELIELLRKDTEAMANENVEAGLKEMSLLFDYLKAYDITSKVSFDLSLARGLDYYTGLIYEVVTKLPPDAKAHDEESRIGSIAAGGRYDNLVGMFGKRQIPCVGISFGVDRIFTILKTRQEKEKQAARKADVYIMAFGGKGFDGLLAERMAIARMLWKEGIRTEFSAKVKPKLPQQFKAAETNDIPLAVILGEGEVAEGKLRLKRLGLGEGQSAEEKDGRLLAKEDLVAEVKKYLAENA
ncbi:histidyl-tRNA synthetase-like protein [Stachybotrys elegans]|uniref:Histidine--tRNA ligase, mitochondrial n=1 Tax=Stachybotrys elegans TaxID=80388 RepID=A0A8K0SK73_9HYPO|nr:histidyl-tRNA synthetase-like protein [Stachybotrys elegans]